MRDPFVGVVVVHPQALYLDALSHLIRSDPKLHLLATCASADVALQATSEHKADVLLIDARTLGSYSREWAWPARLRLIALGGSDTSDGLVSLLDGSVSGVVVGSASGTDLLECIHYVAKGGSYFPHSVVMRALERSALKVSGIQLTEREREVAHFVAQGKSNKGIAQTIGISEGTVKAHVHSIFRKLNVGNRVQLSLEMRERAID